MKLNKDEYKKAEGCLRRYNYNCITIINIRADIMTVGVPSNDGMPKAPYNISDSVYNQYIKLQEDKELQKSLTEYKAVKQGLELVNKDSKGIFEYYYLRNKSRWETMDILGLSERSFVRRKGDLIFAVNKELKKSWREIGVTFQK